MILKSLFFDSRAHPSNPSNWMLYGLSGSTPSKSGAEVSEENSLESSAVWNAITLLASTIASLPLPYYRRLKPRGKERVTDNALYRLLHTQPNQEMTAMQFREAQAGQCIVWGNCYAEKIYDGAGRLAGLWPLLSRNMDMDRIDGQLIYKYRLPDGQTKLFQRDRILHIAGFSDNGIIGHNVIQKQREPIGLGKALEEYAARWFGNGARPSVALTHPMELSPQAQERLRKNWQDIYGGLSNSHRTAILEEGMKLEKFGMSPEESQAIDARKFSVTEVARIFNVPPHFLKDLERATYGNIEQQSLEFVIYTLRPWLVRFEQAYNTQLLEKNEQATYFWEHLVDGLLRGDLKQRYDAYAIGKQWGWLSSDDIRELENMNPIGGRAGGIYLQPLNMVDAAEDPPEPAPNSGFRSAELRAKSIDARKRIIRNYRGLLLNAAQEVINREALAVKKQIDKINAERGVPDMRLWLQQFYAEHPEYVRKKIGPVMRSMAGAIVQAAVNEIGTDPNQAQFDEFLEKYIDGYVARHVQSSERQLQALVDGDLSALEQRVDEWRDKRPDKIADNESTRANGAFYQFAAFAAGLGTYWRTQGKSCPLCQTLNGKLVRSGQPLLSAGQVVDPQDGETAPIKARGLVFHPPLHAGCTCTVSIF